MFSRCDVFLAAAVTPVHVGVGRSPGTVDLPVARDEYGLPYLPASSLKGSAKSLCIRAYGRGMAWQCERVYGWDIRLQDGVPEEPYVSPVAFTDAVLLLYPVRVEELNGEIGFAYATSRLQLARISDLIEVCSAVHVQTGPPSWLRELLGEKEEASKRCSGDATGDGQERIYMNNVPVEAKRYKRVYVGGEGDDAVDAWGRLANRVKSMSMLASRLLGGNAKGKQGAIYIVEDDVLFREVVEAGVLRVTRVALDPETKTVRTGALWSEEYVSQGAVFLFAVFYRDSGDRAAPADEAMRLNRELLLRGGGGYLVVGGKETIGRGILRLECLTCSEWG